ncbi:MAG TPA: hypothetical protein VH142_18390 [Polyangiaceae bacterium]|jgi:hypothetical protein|nr:hypothetical protein [Polyangiaceae bacterium]
MMRRRLGDDSGLVYLEFLLAIFPVMLVFLGTVQLALSAAAQLVVRHAAVNAVRSAIVVLDDDPVHYSGAARGELGQATSPTDALVGVVNNVAQGMTFQKVLEQFTVTSRLDVIRRAASAPLAPFAPSASEVIQWFLPNTPESVARAVGSSGLDRPLFGLLAYDAATVAVTFPDAPASTTLATTTVSSDSVTVRVTYLFRCGVPVVAALACKSLTDVLSDSNASRELAHVADTRERDLLKGTHERFLVLTAEATLPRQSAGYEATKNAT